MAMLPYMPIPDDIVFVPPQDAVLSTLSDWLGDSACNRNPTVLLISGIVYSQEGMYDEALKACHVGLILEL
jgi:hypothetical protein